MTARRSQSERLAILEQQVSHMEAELERMSGKVDEMHAILLQARGVRWAIIALAGLVGFLAGHLALGDCESVRRGTRHGQARRLSRHLVWRMDAAAHAELS